MSSSRQGQSYYDILASATEDELVRSGNAAYKALQKEKVKLECSLEVQK